VNLLSCITRRCCIIRRFVWKSYINKTPTTMSNNKPGNLKLQYSQFHMGGSSSHVNNNVWIHSLIVYMLPKTMCRSIHSSSTCYRRQCVDPFTHRLHATEDNVSIHSLIVYMLPKTMCRSIHSSSTRYRRQCVDPFTHRLHATEANVSIHSLIIYTLPKSMCRSIQSSSTCYRRQCVDPFTHRLHATEVSRPKSQEESSI